MIYNVFSIITLFLVGILYSVLLFIYPSINKDSFITIVFLAIIFSLFILNIKVINKNSLYKNSYYKYIAVLMTLALHSGILLGCYFVDVKDSILWVVDSYEMHLPGAINVANYLAGNEGIRDTGSAWDKIYFTHILVGIFFYVFGISPIISSIVLMFAKMGTVFVIFLLGKRLFDNKIAAIAAVIYSLMPTILLYTLVFYKEAIIQFLVVSIILFFHDVFNAKRKVYSSIMLVILLSLIMNERFYLFPIFVAIIYMNLLFDHSIGKTIKIIFSMIILLASIQFYLIYSTVIDFANILQIVEGFRVAYNSYDDVNDINANLPYVLSIIKLIFTPFFTLNKFDLFGNFSYILIWGSIFNQVVIAISLIGMYKSLSLNFKKHWYVITPFIIFLSVFAYVSPYNGRLRDSFYPIIVIYAGYGMTILYTYYKKYH